MIDTKAIRELCDKATPGPWHGSVNAFSFGVSIGEAKSIMRLCEGIKRMSDAEFIARSRTLIPALCDALEAAQSTLEQTWEWDMYQCAKREIERLRKELGATQNAQRWIPVTERLPEFDESEITKLDSDRGEPVLVVEDGHVVAATWWIREKVFRVDGFKVEPTYWMQLPEPPKGDAK